MAVLFSNSNGECSENQKMVTLYKHTTTILHSSCMDAHCVTWMSINKHAGHLTEGSIHYSMLINAQQ